MRRRRITPPPPPSRDGAEAWLALVSALKSRVRAALESERLLGEPEVRRLAEQGRACSLMLASALRRGEERLRDLDGDPESALADVAQAFRDVTALRRDLDELESLLGELEELARAARAAWLTAVVRSAASASSPR